MAVKVLDKSEGGSLLDTLTATLVFEGKRKGQSDESHQ
jgi:hypothetical protein